MSWIPPMWLSQRLCGHMMSATPSATYGNERRQLPKNPIHFQQWIHSDDRSLLACAEKRRNELKSNLNLLRLNEDLSRHSKGRN